MEVKKANKTDWNSIDQFLTENLRPNAEWKLSDEYPLAFSDKNLPNIRFIEKDEKVVSHAVVHPTMIRTHYHLFKVALIGSVVTDPKCQGKGYSRAVIESCTELAHQNDCDFALLWTDLFNFYAKFGFEVAGSEIALQVDEKFNPPNKTNLKILNSKKVSAQALLNVYNQHNLKTVRHVSDIQKYLNIPNSELYTAWNQQTNKLEAYSVVGKGADFYNYIHEWGGQVSTQLSLVQHIQQEKKQKITLITPPQCENLIRQFKQYGAEEFFGVLGMIKIINPVAFCKKIKRGARALGYNTLVFEHRDGIYYFGSENEIYQTDSDQDITRLAFGPLKPEQIHDFSPETLEIFQQIFPIPFWVWGWDSI